MKLKLDANGAAILQDGKPVYVNAEGADQAFDVPGMHTTISRLNGEAKSHRERAEALEATLKRFDGIKDPDAAIKALNTVANLDAKKLVDAGEVEKVKAEAIKAVEAQFAPIVKERDDLRQAIYAEKIGGAFARSKFIVEKTVLPADLAQSHFAKHFKIEGDGIVAYDNSGNKVFSKASPGNPAGFDEALEILIESYASKNSILKGSGSRGSGAQPSTGGAGSKTMTRTDFDKLSAQQRMDTMKAGTTITD